MTKSFKSALRLKPIEYLACIVAVGAIALASQHGPGMGPGSSVVNQGLAQRPSQGVAGSFIDGAQDPAGSSEVDSSRANRAPSGVPGANGSSAADPSTSSALSASPYFWVPPASTMEELIASADAIVIGTVNDILREGNEGPYGPDGELQSPRTMDAVGQGGQVLQHPGLDVTYFEVRIEEVLLNDGRLIPGGSFELRLVGHASRQESEAETIKPLPDVGQRTLFVMGVNPDLHSYGTGLWGEIDISGDQPRYRDWDRTPVVFAEGQSSGDFLDNLRLAIIEHES